jgi:hypothetical protein
VRLTPHDNVVVRIHAAVSWCEFASSPLEEVVQPRTRALYWRQRAVDERTRVDEGIVNVEDKQPLPRTRVIDNLV